MLKHLPLDATTPRVPISGLLLAPHHVERLENSVIADVVADDRGSLEAVGVWKAAQL
jgi:hypothetical protein